MGTTSLRGVALVTGASRGLGRALAGALAEAGMDVALAARDEKAVNKASDTIAKTHGTKCISGAVNVARSDQVEAFVKRVHATLGRIDVLVNNAGIYGPIGTLTDCDVDAWRRAIEVNLFGTMYATRAVLPIMRAQRSGKIINLAGGGVGGPYVAARVSAYATSKAAVVQLTESIAREAEEYGVQVNAVSPGAVVTDMTYEIVQAGEERAGRELYQRTVRERQTGSSDAEPAKRLVVWLASAKSGRLTGKLLAATRDAYQDIDLEEARSSSLFTLRRVDGVHVVTDGS